MQKKITRLYRFFWVALATYFLVAFSSNPPNGSQGYTGAPPNGTTCASANGGCHSGGGPTGNVMITGLPATITPSTMYPLTVTVNRTNMMASRAGFQMTALDDSNNFIGTFSNPGPNSSLGTAGGLTLHEHSPAQNFGGGNTITYTVNWMSPATGSGNVTLYAASLLGNGSGTSGDMTVTTTSSGMLQGGGGVISVNVSGNDVPCFGESSGSATASPSGGGGGPYTYAWSNGGNMQTINNLPAGVYMVTVTNTTGGMGTGSVTINQPSSPVSVSIINQTNITCNSATGTATAQGTGGTPSWTYAWSNGSTGPTASFPSGGTFTVTVTDANQCTSTATVDILENVVPPIAEAGPTGELSCAATSITLNGSGSSTGPDISYFWETSDGLILNGQNTLFPEVGATGTYFLTVTNNSNGCSSSDQVEVIETSSLPTADAGDDMLLTCSNATVTLDGSGSSSGGNFTYQWTTADGNILSGEDTTLPVVDASGTYTIIVTNVSNGCTATDDVVVNEDTELPIASAGPNMSFNCNATSIVLDGTGSSSGVLFIYQWSGPGVQSGGTTATPTVNATGTYTLTVTNEVNGCSSESNVEVTQTPALNVEITGQENVLCNGESTGEATAEASGGNGTYTFAWSNGETTAAIENLPAGMYMVTATDDDDCTSTASVTISEPDELLANASATAESSAGANDGTATAEPEGGNGGYTFEWSNGETTQNIVGLATGNYTVTVTDANLCTAVETVTVASFDCSAFSINISATEPDCNGAATGSATAEPMNGTSPFTFAWSNGDMEATANNLGAGTYSVTVTDDNDCEVVGNVTLGEPTVLAVMATQVANVVCAGEANGSASLSANGGTPMYTFEWPDGNTSPDRNDLAAGSYEVSVTDMNGCEATTTVTISEPPVFTGDVTATDVTSAGANDGTATAEPTSSMPPFIYSWNNGQTGQTITDLPPGEYCVTVTDAEGCTFEGCATVNPFGCGAASSSTSGSPVSCFDGTDGTANVEVTGLTEPISYEWSNGAGEAQIDDLAAGTYTVTATDVNGCSAIDTYEVTEPDELTINLVSVTNLECPDGVNGSATVEGDGGTPDYSYNWGEGTTTAEITDLLVGFYEVTVTDGNNCESTLTVEIGVDPDTEFPNVVTQNITVNLDENGMASITAEEVDGGSTDNCEVAELVVDISNFTCADIGENEVVLAVADAANNCASGTAIVTVVDMLPPVLTCPSDIVIDDGSCQVVVEYDEPTAEDNCGNPTVMLESGLASGGTFPSGDTEVTWAADDGNGNTGTCSFTVTVEDAFMAESTSVPVSCFGEADGTATVNPTAGVEPFTYLWSDGQTTQTAVGLSANTYSVTVTDGEGCMTVTEVDVTEPPTIEITVDGVTNETGTSMNGAIEITVANAQGDLTYEWSLDGTVVSTDEDPSGLSAGEYTLVTTDANGCTAEATVTVDMVSTAFDAELAGRISLFPNPVSQALNIQFELPQMMMVKMSMLDLTGRQVLPERREVLSNQNVILEVSELPSGVYHLRMVVGESVVMKRVVVR